MSNSDKVFIGNKYCSPAIMGLLQLTFILFVCANELLADNSVVINSIACTNGTAPENIISQNGNFSSENYPGNYLSNSLCEWNITALTENPIRIDFIDFQTEPGYDYLYLFDGPDAPVYPEIVRLSGTTLPGSYYTTGQSLYLIFETDSTANFPGFHAKFNGDYACRKGSGRVLNDSYGEIVSPYHPWSYAEDEYCVWKFQPPSNSAVSLSFSSFHLSSHVNCAYAYVDIVDGGTTMGRWCGKNTPPYYYSFSNQVELKFYASTYRHPNRTDFTGFKLGYQIGNELDVLPDHSLKLPLDGYLGTSSGGAISSYCLERYRDNLRTSVYNMRRELFFLLKDNDTLCNSSLGIGAAFSNVTYGINNTEIEIKVDLYLALSPGNTLREHHDCGINIQEYVSYVYNWPQPIIPTPSGCPSLSYRSSNFDISVREKNWWCQRPKPYY